MTNVVSDEIAIIRDFIEQLRKKHGIIPGSSARGLGSDEMGEVGAFVYDELVRTPDNTGAWGRLVEDQEFLGRVYAFVMREITQ